LKSIILPVVSSAVNVCVVGQSCSVMSDTGSPTLFAGRTRGITGFMFTLSIVANGRTVHIIMSNKLLENVDVSAVLHIHTHNRTTVAVSCFKHTNRC